jgi:hypothetical protein
VSVPSRRSVWLGRQFAAAFSLHQFERDACLSRRPLCEEFPKLVQTFVVCFSCRVPTTGGRQGVRGTRRQLTDREDDLDPLRVTAFA